MSRLEDLTWAALRIVTGFLFTIHGVQKVFDVLAVKPAPEMWSQKWIGGVIELVGGALITVGLFTRPVAFLCAGTMAVAYFQFHWMFQGGTKILPMVNGGELAALYCFVFLALAAKGGGAASLDRARGRR